MNRFAAIIFTILCVTGISAQNVDATQSFIKFQIKNFNVHTVNGHFTTFKGNIHLTPTLENKGDVCLSIDIATIDTGVKKRDEVLQSKKFFHTELYPQIRFESNDIYINSDSTFIANGILSMKGISKAISIPFAYSNKHFKGELTLNRLDFEVGGKDTFVIDDDVKIQFDCTIN
ncbi:YceI family protein [Carboxylicivirga sp. A043]|uniref:YceI family protein n=1 Tax=Carboxylicivirga litoralis TaxID=2816963 RepID=UPI0021CB10C9|nr:YceI family protein [Carboxylicivirga sp. A043]MCU4156703.1 YceI family protein [Carboxylicivirga sp. A043]